MDIGPPMKVGGKTPVIVWGNFGNVLCRIGA